VKQKVEVWIAGLNRFSSDEAVQKIMQNHPRLACQLLSSVIYLARALDIPH